MKNLLKDLYSKDNKEAYNALLELEKDAVKSNKLYESFDELLDMLSDDKTFVRVRGFRLICELARWDNDNKINSNIKIILNELDDNTSTSVRQCLNKLNILLEYKPELSKVVKTKLKKLDLSKYKDSMQSLIKKDIDAIINTI